MQSAQNTANLIEESITKSSAGKGKVDHIAGSIRLITAESSRIKTLVDDVKLGSQEQALAIAQIG